MKMRRSTGTTFLIILAAIAAGLLIADVFMDGYELSYFKELKHHFEGMIYGKTSIYCSDGLPCTRDFVRLDKTCESRPYHEGYDCSADDVCYYPQPVNQSSLYPKYCCQKQCVSNRSRCLGVCPSLGIQIGNASTCNYSYFPLNYAQFQNVSLSCIYGSCTVFTVQMISQVIPITEVDLFNTSSCPRTIAFPLSKCIVHHCVTINASYTFCIFRFRCATFDLYGTSLLDSILSSESHQEGDDEEKLRDRISHIQSGGNKKAGFATDTVQMPTFGDAIPGHYYHALNQELNHFISSFVTY